MKKNIFLFLQIFIPCLAVTLFLNHKVQKVPIIILVCLVFSLIAAVVSYLIEKKKTKE